MKVIKSITILGIITIITSMLTSCNDGNIYTGTWSSLYGEGNLHNSYSHSIFIELNPNGSLKVYERDTSGSGINSCASQGSYSISNNEITVSGVTNSNCPWMSKVNGTYYSSENSEYYILKNNYLKVLKEK